MPAHCVLKREAFGEQGELEGAKPASNGIECPGRLAEQGVRPAKRGLVRPMGGTSNGSFGAGKIAGPASVYRPTVF